MYTYPCIQSIDKGKKSALKSNALAYYAKAKLLYKGFIKLGSESLVSVIEQKAFILVSTLSKSTLLFSKL